MMNPFIEIAGRRIGPGYPVYVVAELSANHNQNFEVAAQSLRAAKEAGADAMKLQTYTPETLTVPCDNPHFKIEGTPWRGRSLYELYRSAYMPWEWQPKLKRIADRLGLTLFSTAADESSVDFLERLEVPAYKISSFENGHLPLLRKVAKTKKPLLLSTGLATQDELELAVQTLREAGGTSLALLKCTSAYPAPLEVMNLRTLPDLAQRFQVPVGLSDHTIGTIASVGAVALGACIIEKHFTLSRSMPTPDRDFSMEPKEFKGLVEAIRCAEKSLGQPFYGITPCEEESRIFRRSLFVVKEMKTGELFSEENVRILRPGHGLKPSALSQVLGRRATRPIPCGAPLTEDLIDGGPATQGLK